MALWAFVDLLSIFIFFFFSAYLWTRRTKYLHNKLIAGYLLLLVISYTLFILRIYYKVELIHNIKFLKHADNAIEVLLSPIIYFYTISLLYSDFKFSRKDIWHVIPFIFFLFLPNLNSFLRHLLDVPSLHVAEFAMICLFVQMLFYKGKALQVISQEKKIPKSNEEKARMYKLNWLTILIISLIVLWALIIGCRLWLMFSDITFLRLFTYVKIVSLIAYATIIFTGMHFSETISMSAVPERYYYSDLDEAEKEIALKKLKEYMLAERPYLDSELTLEKVGAALDIKPRNLSQIINEKLGKNFKEYINTFRLNESISQLKNVDNKSKTILEIIYDSGFNSKSAFYNLFRDHTGQSPIEYRKSVL